MIQGVSKNGFSFVIDEEVLDDWELFEDMADADIDPAKAKRVMYTILGFEQMESLKQHLRNTKGRIPISAMLEEFESILNAAKETKNF